VAGVAALVAGMVGSKLGVQFSLATLAWCALPWSSLGGLTRCPAPFWAA
jgi:branched-chain amino acid transport system permease protein